MVEKTGDTHTSGFHARKSVNAIEKFVSITVQVSPDLSKCDQTYSLSCSEEGATHLTV